MSNTMTAHEPINYLDSILNEEEKRCEYSHQWRNFTISRSGRFKSKNKHRNAVDGKMFDHTASAGTTSNTSSASASSSVASTAMGTSSAYSTSSLDKDKISSHYGSSTFASTKSYQNQTASAKSISSSSATTRQRDKMETYKSYYETNL
ncbi:uncharacterized protein LOC111684680 [Lucilia cuprina]|uniref:uncharacterized protein LOC111684680 n=1 Tax=Lucilia cuprina TaxID=7375 RepID=UPI001F051C2A|nr:uncharacterized protein LOC111684680 [Lucilia cuprina]